MGTRQFMPRSTVASTIVDTRYAYIEHELEVALLDSASSSNDAIPMWHEDKCLSTQAFPQFFAFM